MMHKFYSLNLKWQIPVMLCCVKIISARPESWEMNFPRKVANKYGVKGHRNNLCNFSDFARTAVPASWRASIREDLQHYQTVQAQLFKAGSAFWGHGGE
jgi:hypothetical protein